MQVSQAFKFRRFGMCLVASSILIHHFGSIKLFPPWCILLVRLCVFSSLQNNITFFWYHEPPCLNKPITSITLTLIQGFDPLILTHSASGCTTTNDILQTCWPSSRMWIQESTRISWVNTKKLYFTLVFPENKGDFLV